MNQVTVPNGFIVDVFEKEFSLPPDALESIWRKLQRRETFTKGQLFPYRVEFAANSQEGEFASGELNIHHGPFSSVHGAIGEISETHRGLNYFYGSYVLSFRLIRPLQLDFYRDDKKLKVQLKCFVRPWLRPFWRLGNQLLWTSFRYSI